MTPADRHTQLDNERQQLRNAMQRLLTGTARRSNGKHTITTLATESGLSRQRLYEHHADLVTEFKTTAAGSPVSPDVQALQQQLANSHETIQQLKQDNTALHERIRTLCAVITELTQEANADNIVAIPTHRRRR